MSDPLLPQQVMEKVEENDEVEIVFDDAGINLEDVDLECAQGSDNNTTTTARERKGNQICGGSETPPASPSSMKYWPIRVKSERDVLIRVRPGDTVKQVKETVLEALCGSGESGNNHRRNDDDKRYIRLVCRGRLLAPDHITLIELKFVQPNDVVHAVLTTQRRHGQRTGVQAAIQQGNLQSLSRRALRSAGINAQGMAVRRSENNTGNNNNGRHSEDDDSSSSDGEVENDLESGQQTRPRSSRERRGFDRLRLSGLSRGEISAIRSYFSRHVDRFVETHPTLMTEILNMHRTGASEDAVFRRQLEEEAWMYSQGPASEFRLNLPATAVTLNISSGMQWLNAAYNTNGGGESNNSNSNNTNPWVSELRATAASSGISNEDGAVSWPRRVNSSNGGLSSTRPTSSHIGNDRDFLCGFMLGFFVGFLMLIWVWMPTVPHKQKLGILTGITCQLALNTLSPQNTDDDETNTDLFNSLDGIDRSIPNAYYKLGQDMDDAVILG